MNIGQAIKKIRGNMKQREFSKLVGISQTYLSLVEKGHREPNFSVVNSITKATGIPPAVIMFIGLEESDFKPEHQDNFKMYKSFIQAPLQQLFQIEELK